MSRKPKQSYQCLIPDKWTLEEVIDHGFVSLDLLHNGCKVQCWRRENVVCGTNCPALGIDEQIWTTSSTVAPSSTSGVRSIIFYCMNNRRVELSSTIEPQASEKRRKGHR